MVDLTKLGVGLPTPKAKPKPKPEPRPSTDLTRMGGVTASNLDSAPTSFEIEKFEAREFPKDEVGIRGMLDELDRLIQKDGYPELTLSVVQGYVRDVMMELRDHPEYDGVLLSADIHNIMVFTRQVGVKAGTKKATATKKRAVKNEQRDLLRSKMTLKALPSGLAPLDTAELGTLAELDTSGIKPKTRGKK